METKLKLTRTICSRCCFNLVPDNPAVASAGDANAAVGAADGAAADEANAAADVAAMEVAAVSCSISLSIVKPLSNSWF